MLLGLLATCVFGAQAPSPAAPVPDFAVGSVYHDRDADGVRDAGEQGLPGVGVSNGRDVAITSDDGSWRLPAGDEAVFFVIKPRGWMTTTDRDGHPTFWYAYRPGGSQTKRFAGVAPTGPLPASIDFPLVMHEEPNRFRAVVFGDTQVTDQRQIGFLSRDLLEEVAGIGADFGLTLGDNANNDLSVLEPLKAALGATGLTWYYTLGNHDENYDADGDAHADETFLRVLGPANYSFNWGPVHFVVLDDVVWNPEKRGYSPGVSPDQLEFLRNDLQHVPQDALVVYATHIPVGELPDKPAFFEVFRGREHVLALSGHTHAQFHEFFDKSQGWPGERPHHSYTCATACGAWWSGLPDEYGLPCTTMSDGTPNGYNVLTFDGATYSYDFVPARGGSEFQMSIDAPESVRLDRAADTLVSVNVFAGSSRSRVEMRVTPQETWVEMALTSGKPDPTFERMSAAQQSPPEGYSRLGGAYWCPHLWQARLPEGLRPGTWRIDVRTTDMLGRTYAASRIIRID
jgi:hypothetical protein